MLFFRALTGSVFVTLALAQNYCDDAYGAHCPEESGWDVGDCLSKLDVSLQGEKCHDFITLHEACRTEIDEHCVGKEYTGDVLPCLTEWTSIDLISANCKTLFPVKTPKKEKREKTKREKERDKKRKKIRNKAAKLMREQQDEDL